MSSGVKYNKDWKQEWNELAVKTFKAKRDGPDLVFTGTCPRCKDEMTFRYPYIGFGYESTRGEGGESDSRSLDWDEPTTVEVSMWCMCQSDHEAPADKQGCGATWKLSATIPPRRTRGE